jgi:PAS domain S-box-containing protein
VQEFLLDTMPAQHNDSGKLAPVGNPEKADAELHQVTALLKTEALQDAIVTSANFSSIATDENGIVRIFNAGAERMLGYTASEVIGKLTPADISDPLEIIARAASLSQELGTVIAPGYEALVFKASRGIEDIYELTYIRKDGSRFPAVVSVTALRGASGGIVGYLLIATDNTGRKKAEVELRLANRLLRDQEFYSQFIAGVSNGPLLTTDARGIITDVNKQMEILTGRSRKELIGSPFRNAFTDPERAEIDLQRALSEGKLTNAELTARAPDGRQTLLSCNATTFHDRDHKIQGVFASARDITDRARFERELGENKIELERVRAAAKQAGIAKSDLLSSLSHKLRSPLNTILGFAQLIDSDSPPPTLAQTASVEQILRAGWFLLDLVTEILDLAQIDSGKLVLFIEPTSVTEVLRECEALVAPLGRERGVRFTFPDAVLPYFANADRTRLKEILLNVLTNAIKFNRKSGTVTVGCSFVDDKGGSPEHIRITVRDTGAGLTAAKLLKVFEPFSRLRREHGTDKISGVGLATSRRLLELMGGSIGAESKVGKGSLFWLELNATIDPLAALGTEEHKVTAQAQTDSAVRFRTVLHVEDDPSNLKLVEHLMARRPNIQLLSATDGHLGMQLARTNLPDLIIMDINLPGISGLDALRMLRQDPATNKIPVVALSANASPADIEAGLKAGFFRYMTKPFRFEHFMDTLDMALEYAAIETR